MGMEKSVQQTCRSFKLVYVKSRKVEYIYEKAVDMNNDDKITATDLSQLKMMLVGMPSTEEVNPEKEDNGTKPI